MLGAAAGRFTGITSMPHTGSFTSAGLRSSLGGDHAQCVSSRPPSPVPTLTTISSERPSPDRRAQYRDTNFLDQLRSYRPSRIIAGPPAPSVSGLLVVVVRNVEWTSHLPDRRGVQMKSYR